MVRALIIALNFFFAWIFSVMTGTPSATVSGPQQVNKGEAFTVNVKINPNGEEKFVRYAMTIPQGWTAENINSAGATFKVEENVVKFIWSEIGKKEEVNISFKLTPPPSAEGTFEFPSKLSHSVDNLPSHIALDPLKVQVGNANTNTGNYVPETSDSTAKPSASVTASRTVPTEPVTGEFFVDVVINKGDLGSYIKLQDTLPEGFLAKPVSIDGGDWSFEKGIVKVQWYSPNKVTSALNVRYKVITSPDANGTHKISGHVSYVENMNNKIINLAPSTVQLIADPALATNNDNKTPENPVNNTTTDNSNNNNTSNTNASTNNNSNQNTDNPVQNTVANNNQNTNSSSDNTSSVGNDTRQPDNSGTTQPANTSTTPGVSYSIQIAAMQRRVETSYYQSTYGLNTVNAEQVDGLNKYTTGKHSTYQEARDNRETVRSKGVQGPFVVAYSNGKRITVQEALMITSQKWIR
jgi:hypothetical protein